MKWKEDYATGIKEIDEQHRSLFEMTDTFRDELDKGAGARFFESFLEFLSTFIRIHFGYEENCMLACQCPFAEQNKAEHEAFVKVIEKEAAAYQRDGYDDERARALLDRIERWLDSHICRVDIQLRDCASSLAAPK